MLFYSAIFLLMVSTVLFVIRQRKADIKQVKSIIQKQIFYCDGEPVSGDSLYLVSVRKTTPRVRAGVETHFTIYGVSIEDKRPFCIQIELLNKKLKKAHIRPSREIQLDQAVTI